MDEINQKMHQAMGQMLDQIIENPDADNSQLCDQLETMYKSRTEYEKVAQAAREHEAQVREHRKDILINTSVQVGLAAAGWAIQHTWYRMGLDFEKFGAYTSFWVKNVISKITRK